jgi:rhodanese-related sulfurtransferase/DNA-binding transcriptional ArsR family regulator
MGDPTLKASLFEQLARVGKALANGKRLELVDLLAQGERTVESLARTAGLGLTTTSAHLQTLKSAGLVATRRDGTRIYYRLAGLDVADLYTRLRDLATARIAEADLARAAYLGESADDVDKVTREELLNRVAAGDVVVLDVRPAEEYSAGHVPGAVSIPVEELPARFAELPADVEIVAYCRGAYCVLAHDAVRLLDSEGRRALRLDDGMLEWRLADLAVETGAA